MKIKLNIKNRKIILTSFKKNDFCFKKVDKIDTSY